MRRAALTILMLALLLAATGCVRVKPWERDLLAQRSMGWEPDTLEGKRTGDGLNADGTGNHDALIADPENLEALGDGEGTFTSRGYGRDGSAFPNDDNRGPCITGEACRIWDGAVNTMDTGDGGAPVAAQALAIPQAEDVIVHRLRRPETFLKGASEVLFDGLGDEDGLCESGEACTLDPNLGAHQGEAGDGIVDEVIGFELAPPVRNAPPRVEDVHLDARVGL